MKKIILLLFTLLNIFIISNDIDQNLNEDESSLVLLLTNQNGDTYFTSTSLNKLKKCSFPVGPLRNNNIQNNDLKKVSQNIATRIQESIRNKEYLQLPSFCIDSEDLGIKNKTCGFSIPSKGDMCYVFKFESSLKEIISAILTNEQLNDLEIDIATDNIESTDQIKPVKDIPTIQKWLIKFALKIFIESEKFIEKSKESYNKLISYIKTLNLSHAKPKA